MKKDNSLSVKDQAESVEHVIREILQYLVDHPDAKDTGEGIYKWWLREADTERGRGEVEKALDLLTSKRWLTMRNISQFQKIYGFNMKLMEEIRKFLNETGKVGEIETKV